MIPVLVGARPSAVLEAMARELARGRDPYARHWLVLPGSGRGRWLQQRWASLAGIAAHAQSMDLRALVNLVAAEGEPFSLERLGFAIAAALPACPDLPLPDGMRVDAIDARALGWAQQMAEAIDQGLLCRSDDRRWGDRPFLGRLARVPAVAAALAGHLGLIAPEAFARTATAWRDGWARRPGGVPHLWIHLDAGLPAVLLARLVQLLQLLPPDRVHLSMLDPGDGYWGDLRTGRRRGEDDDAGPVLRPFGRCAQDLHNQMIDAVLGLGAGDVRLDAEEEDATLLGRLQRCCRTAMAPTEPEPLAADDVSVTVHSCRSALRELEVCRDRILQAMADDPDLAPGDVLLLLADPENLAPLVGAALQPDAPSGEATPIRLPFRLAGVGASVASPVASSLQRLLRALPGRLDLATVQELLEDPLIAQRFGLDGAGRDGARSVAWLVDAGLRWGVDGAHRAAEQGVPGEQWSLAFALRRLGLGAVVDPAVRDGVVDGVAPLDRAAGLSLAALAGLAVFARHLTAARAAWAGDQVRAVPEWCAALRRLCADFLAPADRTAREHLAALLDDVLPALERAGADGPALRTDAMARLLDGQLAQLGERRAAEGGGGILVGDLQRLAGTPARLVLVAGLGCGAFPRQEDRPAWHPLAGPRRPGDPDRRDADRHALLLALLGCSWRLVLAYQGGSDADAKPRPPSTPLADLLDAIDRVLPAAADGPAHRAVLHVHGLNGFSPAAFASALPASARGRSAADWNGARLLAAAGRTPPWPGPWTWSRAPLAGPRTVTVKDLLTLLEEPCRLFLQYLGIHAPEEADELPEGDPVALPPLAAWAVRDRIVRCRMGGGSLDDLRARMIAAGDLPPGLIGSQAWQDAVAAAPLPGTGPFTPSAVPLAADLDVDGVRWRIEGRLPDGWYTDAEGRLLRVSASRNGARHRLATLVGLLLLARQGGPRAVTAHFQGAKPVSWRLAEGVDLDARLAHLLRLHALALRRPLPWWVATHEKMKADDPARSVDDLCRDAIAHWSPDFEGDHAVPDGSLPATRLCFRGCDDPFREPMPMQAEWLPDPDAPLACRLARSVAQWEAGLVS